MATYQESVVDGLVASLGADASIPSAKVYRNREEAFEDSDLPGYVVSIDDEAPVFEEPTNISFIDTDLSLNVDLYLRTDAASPDQELLAMRKFAHRGLMADIKQGTAFIISTTPLGADEPIIDNEGERINAMYRTRWSVRFRTPAKEIDQSPP